MTEAEQRLAERGGELVEDRVFTDEVWPAERVGYLALYGDQLVIFHRPGIDEQDRQWLADWAWSRIQRLEQHGFSPDGWEQLDHETWLLWGDRWDLPPVN